jgi:tetratricopeptide (TPR) repeat protein
MKNLINLLLMSLAAVFLFVSCYQEAHLPDLPAGVQAVSQLGDTLNTPEIDPATEQEFRDNLQAAVEDYRMDPENADAIIWMGRRTAYLGEYREAVRIFTEGAYKFPEDPRMFRHRGHRYLTLREFDKAIADFRNAVGLMQGESDRTEPDGLPNPLNQPTSTLKSNVWYHLGLSHYLKGNFDDAIQAYENGLDLELTKDMRVAFVYWYYMALKRSGKDESAGAVLETVHEDIELIENDTYLNLLLVFKGIFSPGHLVSNSADGLENSTLGYGIGNWHFINGRTDRAYQFWQDVYDSGQWPAFGFIAAESELARR